MPHHFVLQYCARQTSREISGFELSKYWIRVVRARGTPERVSSKPQTVYCTTGGTIFTPCRVWICDPDHFAAMVYRELIRAGNLIYCQTIFL